jgi:hypothetical protein
MLMSLSLLCLSTSAKWKHFNRTADILLAMKEDSARCSIFPSLLCTSFEYFSVRVVQPYYRHYRLTLPFNCLHCQQLSGWSPNQAITIIQNDINVKTSSTGNDGKREKKSYLHFCSNWSPPTTSLSIVLQM